MIQGPSLLQSCLLLLAIVGSDCQTPNCVARQQSCQWCASTTACGECMLGNYLSGNVCSPCPENCLTCDSDGCSACIAAFTLDSGTCQSKSQFYIYILAGGISCFVAIVITVVCCYLQNKREGRTIGAGRIHLRVDAEPAQTCTEVVLPKQWELRPRKTACEEVCSFCLEGRVDLELSCSHFYHTDCLAMWLTRHTDCPLCKREVIATAHRYCSNCLLYSFPFPAMLISSAKGKIDCRSCLGVTCVDDAGSLPENRLCITAEE